MSNDHVFFKYVMKLPPESRPYKSQVHYVESKITAHFCTLRNKKNAK